jgi:hypothetical protein
LFYGLKTLPDHAIVTDIERCATVPLHQQAGSVDESISQRLNRLVCVKGTPFAVAPTPLGHSRL